MMISKEQLVNAVVKFIAADLIPQVGDRNTKFVLAMAKDSLKENGDLADDFLHSPMVLCTQLQVMLLLRFQFLQQYHYYTQEIQYLTVI